MSVLSRPRAAIAAALTTGLLASAATIVAGPSAHAAEDPSSLRAEAAALTTQAQAAEQRAERARLKATRSSAKAEILKAQSSKARKQARTARTRAVRAADRGQARIAIAWRRTAAAKRAAAQTALRQSRSWVSTANRARKSAVTFTVRSTSLHERADSMRTQADVIEARTSNEMLLAETLRGWNIPGAQVVHTKDGVVDSYVYGVQSNDTGVVANEHSLFQGASLTKVVASYLFLKRVDEGVIDLDTPLWNYFQSPRAVESSLAKTITARHVLSHTTGLPNWVGAANNEDTQLVPAFVPGTDWGYSGEGFFLLQRTVEHLDQQPLAQTLKEEVFTPLGMEDSTLVTLPENAPRTAVGHNADGSTIPMSNFVPGNAAYTLQTTAQDYNRFIQRALIGGEGLQPATHALWTAEASDADRDPVNAANPFISWGLGVGIQTNGKGKALWHWGDNGTRRAFFLAFPETGESVVMFWNSANGQKSAGAILNQFLAPQANHALTWVG